MKFMWRRYLIAIALPSIAVGCGSRLPKEVNVNKPTAEEAALNAADINFLSLSTDQEVNLKDYMETRQLSHMLLTFGSESCAACMEKTHYLETNLVNHYELVEGQSGTKFEVVGVNVDPDGRRKSVAALALNEGLTHLKWQDPSGDTMIKYFQPKGLSRSVPLAVMINRKEIMWRVASNEKVTPKELIEKVAASLGQEKPDLPAEPAKPKPPSIKELSILADERPDRLEALPVRDCKGGVDVAPLSAQYVFSSHGRDEGLKFVLADSGHCEKGSVCAQNQDILKEFLPQCAGLSCDAITIADGLDAADGEACSRSVYKGSGEIYATFADHFNWNLVSQDASGKMVLGTVTEPVTLGFSKSGQLVFSHKGLLDTAELKQRLVDQFSNLADGPAFKMYFEKSHFTTFATTRLKSKYTVMVFWYDLCGSCVEEVDHFHKSGQLMDFCDAHQDICQVSSLYTDFGDGISGSDPTPSIFDDINAFKSEHNWRMPVSLDPFNADTERTNRWFDGWFKARTGLGVNGTVVFDREAKLRGAFEADPNASVGPLELIKKLERM
jgi:hypothetical protein